MIIDYPHQNGSTIYLKGNSVKVMTVIPAMCEPVDALKLTKLTKLSVEIIFPPAEQFKVLLVKKETQVNISFTGPKTYPTPLPLVYIIHHSCDKGKIRVCSKNIFPWEILLNKQSPNKAKVPHKPLKKTRKLIYIPWQK